MHEIYGYGRRRIYWVVVVRAVFIGSHIVDRLMELGWSPSYNSADTVRDTARVLIGSV